jgi:hypothetical protein
MLSRIEPHGWALEFPPGQHEFGVTTYPGPNPAKLECRLNRPCTIIIICGQVYDQDQVSFSSVLRWRRGGGQVHLHSTKERGDSERSRTTRCCVAPALTRQGSRRGTHPGLLLEYAVTVIVTCE